MKEPSKKEQTKVLNFIKYITTLTENERKQIYKDMLKKESFRKKNR